MEAIQANPTIAYSGFLPLIINFGVSTTKNPKTKIRINRGIAKQTPYAILQSRKISIPTIEKRVPKVKAPKTLEINFCFSLGSVISDM